MPKGKPHPRLSSSDDDEDDTTPLCELKGVQAAKTAKTAAAAFKEKEHDEVLKTTCCMTCTRNLNRREDEDEDEEDLPLSSNHGRYRRRPVMS